MKKFIVLTDSTSDISKKDRELYNIDYLKMTFTINEKEYDADLDWKDITPEEYYGLMRKGYRSITGLVKTIEFETKFEEALKNGYDVLYVACSSKLSGSLNNGKLVAAELQDKYKDRKIICFDSLRSNYAEAMIAIEAAKKAEEGKTIDEAVEELSKIRLNYQTYATVNSLEWLKKAGRVKASKAFFGTLFGVKPIIVGDSLGYNTSFKKEKGRKNSLDFLANTIQERLLNPQEGTLVIEHADCLIDAQYLEDKVKELIPSLKEIIICPLGPIIGATTGPETITCNFYGAKVTVTPEE